MNPQSSNRPQSRPRRILLTRSAEGNKAWAEELAAQSYEAVSLPCLRHHQVDDEDTARHLASLWRPGEWWLFTSPRGVQSTHALLSKTVALHSPNLSPDLLSSGERPKIGAVGPATAEICERLLGGYDLVASPNTGKALAQSLVKRLDAEGQDLKQVVVAAADRGRRDLEEILEPRGVKVERITVYSTAPAARNKGEEPTNLEDLDLDGVFIASPSAMEGLDALAQIPPSWDVPVVAIGPTTASSLEGRGFRVSVSESPSLTGMLHTLGKALNSEAS